jgi:hypothetical protein
MERLAFSNETILSAFLHTCACDGSIKAQFGARKFETCPEWGANKQPFYKSPTYSGSPVTDSNSLAWAYGLIEPIRMPVPVALLDRSESSPIHAVICREPPGPYCPLGSEDSRGLRLAAAGEGWRNIQPGLPGLGNMMNRTAHCADPPYASKRLGIAGFPRSGRSQAEAKPKPIAPGP